MEEEQDGVLRGVKGGNMLDLGIRERGLVQLWERQIRRRHSIAPEIGKETHVEGTG